MTENPSAAKTFSMRSSAIANLGGPSVAGEDDALGELQPDHGRAVHRRDGVRDDLGQLLGGCG